MKSVRKPQRLAALTGAFALVIGIGILLDAVAGPLDPPGPPSSTMHSLSEIGDLGDAVSALVFDETLGGSADVRGELFASFTGVNQGSLAGDVTVAGFEDSSRVLGLDYGVVVPFDPANGQQTGQRQHLPVTLRMNVERNWPELYRAMLTSEELTVITEWVRPDYVGVYFEIRLEEARIEDIRQIVQPKAEGQGHLIDVRLVFDRIVIIDHIDNNSASDNLGNPA